jgi:glucose-6-phosphate 1-epimerase
MTASTVADLNKRFGIAGVAVVEAGEKGLPRVAVKTAVAEGHVYLHGAHVSHYQRTGEAPMLYMDKSSWFETGKPIRGGVPVIFPWFGANANDKTLPAHGLVRQREWELVSIAPMEKDAVCVTLAFKSNEETRKAWANDFELIYRVVIGKTLSMSLIVKNTGTASFNCENALHTYFRVGDIHFATVSGLENTSYLSKVGGSVEIVNPGDSPVKFEKETDRVYFNTRAVCVIKDPILNRHILVEKEGSLATVVWNPWIDKAKAMPDFTDDAWPTMVCVEAVNAGFNGWTVNPGESRALTQIVH